MQNPSPQTAEQLTEMLDNRILGSTSIQKVPNQHMVGFSAGHEMRKLAEDERLALVAKTHERFAGED